MKKRIQILSLLGLFVATAVFIILFSSKIIVNNTTQCKYKFEEAFPLNQAQFINFQIDEDSFSRLTNREQKDQLRDWLLFTVVSNKNADEINQSLYDLSPVRYGYMKPVSNFEYGDTRSLYVGDGTVVAILPQDISQVERIDDLAHIADKHRQNLGSMPTSLEIFEYEINPELQYASLTHKEKLKAEKIFTEKQYGYHQTEVKSLEDLYHLMSQVDDITFAQVKGSSLIVGGRKIFNSQYRGINVEDVAAIWQSEKKIQEQLNRWKASGNYTSLLTPSDESLRHRHIEGILGRLLEKQKPKLVNGSGFSLDPSYDYRSLEKYLVRAKPSLNLLVSANPSVISTQDIQEAEEGLAKDNVVPYLKLVDKLTSSDDLRVKFFGKVLSSVERKYRFQTARYDGDLQGTEVGMVLFYTDLLAKLWALDYLGSTPEKYISDFKPLTKISSTVSPIYQKEIEELPSTRVWFGHQDKGFQVADNGKSLFFARNATRIYAASSNPLEPGKETTAAASSEAFLGWWNEHYEEVARYEPEYERLNEIMKWSLLISWLNASDQGELLGFLQGVEVKQDNWFPSWVQVNSKQLTFKKWDQVGFYERGYLGKETEAMPLLSSKSFISFGQKRYISGGVSLANKNLFQGRSSLSTEVNKLSRRAHLDYNSFQSGSNSSSFKTLEGTTYSFTNVDEYQASTTAHAKDGTKLRSPESELANGKFTRQVKFTDSGLEIETEVDGTQLGSLGVTGTGNGFDIGWQSRDIDEGTSLALKLSQNPRGDTENILLSDPRVKSVVQLNDEPGYFVEMTDSKRWLKLATGGGGNSNIPPNWKSRVGSPGDSGNGGNKNFLLAWVDEQQVKKKLNDETAKAIIYDSESEKHPSFVDNLNNEQYAKVGQKITDNPDSFWESKSKYYQVRLKEIDDLRKKGFDVKSAQKIDKLIKKYGEKTDLKLRKVAIKIKRKIFDVEEIRLPDKTTISKEKSRKNFEDQFNEILKNSKDETNFIGINRKKEFIYVQDSPDLNNLDWSVPIEDAIPQIPGNNRAYRLEDGEIGDAKVSTAGFDDAFPQLDISKSEFDPLPQEEGQVTIRKPKRLIHKPLITRFIKECDEELKKTKPKTIYIVFSSNT